MQINFRKINNSW